MTQTSGTRTVHDSMGEMQVPANALYGASTARAVENFPISNLRFSRAFLRALGLIKGAAASVNVDLGLLDPALASAIEQAAQEVADGKWDAEFPIDIFQTGSGTSTNMNANGDCHCAAQLDHGDTTPHPTITSAWGVEQRCDSHRDPCRRRAGYRRALLPALTHLQEMLETRR